MKSIKNLLLAASLLAFSTAGFAMSITPGALDHVSLNGTNDTQFLTSPYPSGTTSAFYDLTVSTSTNVVANFRGLFAGTLPLDDVQVTISQLFIDEVTDVLAVPDALPLDASVFVTGVNTVAAFLTAGITYRLQFDALTDNPGFSGTISAVPVPAAGILFASALFGAGFLGRRKKKATKSNMIGAFARTA